MPILVAGTHRSGLKLVAQALQVMGFSLGSDRGAHLADYTELASFYELNDQIRTHLGLVYNPALPFPDDWESYDMLDSDLEELRVLLRHAFPNSRNWAIADPRLSLLYPIYENVLSEWSKHPTFVVCVRNPLNVAASAQTHDGVPFRAALGIWLHETLSALRRSKASRRRVIVFEEWLKDPIGQLSPILDLYPEARSGPSALNAIISTVQRDKDHGCHGLPDLEKARPALLYRTYDLGCRMMGAPQKLDQGAFDSELEDLWAEFSQSWELSPSEMLFASQFSLDWRTDGGERRVQRPYLPKPKATTLEVPFDTPANTAVFGALGIWPGTYFVRTCHVVNAAGRKVPIRLEPAPDLTVKVRTGGEIWEIPRAGMHFRFESTGGPQTLSITLSCQVNPGELSRLSGQLWQALSVQKARYGELEKRLLGPSAVH